MNDSDRPQSAAEDDFDPSGRMRGQWRELCAAFFERAIAEGFSEEAASPKSSELFQQIQNDRAAAFADDLADQALAHVDVMRDY